MKLKKEIFRRGVRMTHHFEESLEASDPFTSGTFETPWPKRPSELSGDSRAQHIQQHGEHRYRNASSPIMKPNDRPASLAGPAPDFAMDIAFAIPVGTKKRKSGAK